MKKFILNLLLTVVITAAGWVLFSAFGVIPGTMSLPLPDYLQTYSSPLTVTGRTVRNELIRIGSEYSVEPGTFDSLGLFDNGNIFEHCYYDGDTDILYYGLGDRAYQFDQPARDFEILTEEEFAMILPMDGYEFAFSASEAPALYHKDTFYRSNYWRSGFVKYDKSTKETYFHNELILECLLDAQTERITPEKLATLIWLTYTGRIQYWEPETGTAVFCTEDGEGNLRLDRYVLHETVQGQSAKDAESSHISLSAYSSFAVISGSEYIAYSQQDETVYLVRMDTGERTVLRSEISGVSNLNYCYTASGELVIGGYLSDNQVFWDYTQNEGLCWITGNAKNIYYMSMHTDGVIFIEADNLKPENHGYILGSHEVFRDVEE